MVSPRPRKRQRRRRRRVTGCCIMGLVVTWGLFTQVLQLSFLSNITFHESNFFLTHFAYYKSQRHKLLRHRYSMQHDEDTNSWVDLLIQKRIQKSRATCQQLYNNTNSSMTFATGKDMQQENAVPACSMPPETVCDANTYSILVTWEGKHIRTLFINLLMFVNNARVNQIVMIVSDMTALQLLKQDLSYGQRIWSWHANSKHVLRLSVGSTWDVLAKTKFQNQAVVWIKAGTKMWEGSSVGLDAGFELWKRHSQALVSSEGWRITTTSTTNNDTQDLLQLAWDREQQQQQERQGRWYNYKTYSKQRNDDKDDTTTNQTTLVQDLLFVPICNQQQHYNNNMSKVSTGFQLVAPSGLFFHSNYLCFLPQFHQVRELATTRRFETIAILTILHQVSGQLPWSYPKYVVAKRKNQRRLTESQQQYNTSFGDDDTSKMTTRQFGNAKRLAASNDTITTAADANVWNRIVQYFGNVPVGSMDWCWERQDCNHLTDVSVEDLSWMNSGGFGYSQCQPSWSSLFQ